MPVLTPLWRQSLQERFFKIYTLNGPSDKNFFWVHIKMHIYSYWLMYIHSKWSGQHPGGPSYILGPFLRNLIFSKIFRIGFVGPQLFFVAPTPLREVSISCMRKYWKDQENRMLKLPKKCMYSPPFIPIDPIFCNKLASMNRKRTCFFDF